MIAICALTWNHAPVTISWLNSINRCCEGHEVKLFLGDNGSTDNEASWNIIRAVNPEVAWRNEDNESIYRGWNRLLVDALARDPELICLSNNDLIVSPGWLDPVMREIRKDKAEGALRYFLPNGDYQSEYTFEELARQRSVELAGQTVRADAAWCLFLTPEAAREFLPIPEELQLWYGDNFIHWKLANAGYKCEAILDCGVLHRGSVSFNARHDKVEVVARDREIFNRITGLNL